MGMMDGGAMGMPQQMPMGQPAQGGMLSQQPQQQDNSQYLEMADAILANPSQEMVMRVVQILQQSGNPDEALVAQALMSVANNPEQLRAMVTQIKQSLM